MTTFEPRPLSSEAVPAALQRAQHYRLLNEPRQAESICQDILAVEPDNQEALITLLLALTDQFKRQLGDKFRQAQEVVSKFTDDYHRPYYRGIVCERRANAHVRQGGPGSGHLAYDWYRQAIDAYNAAIELRPKGNDDAILRWNTCARILNSNPELRPEHDDSFSPLLE